MVESGNLSPRFDHSVYGTVPITTLDPFLAFDRDIDETPCSTRLSLYEKNIRFIMPYNTSAIPRPEEVTGTSALPRTRQVSLLR